MAFDCSTIFVPWRHDPHADHEAAARVANVRLLAYPVWGWTLLPDRTVPDQQVGGWRLEIEVHLSAKRRAIAAHESQYGALIRTHNSVRPIPSQLSYTAQ
jgi:LmbE family N-acetylglucosaminyl deacetylase